MVTEFTEANGWMPDTADESRFWSYVAWSANGCAIWTGAHGRYGRFGLSKAGKRFQTTAHRFAYVSVFGHPSEGLQLDHLCRNRLCVAPDHLEAVSGDENRRRQRGAACKRGHDLTRTGAVYVGKAGKRECRECRNYRNRMWARANA